MVAPQGLSEVSEDNEPASCELVNRTDYTSRDVDDALQRHVADTSDYASDDDDEDDDDEKSPIPQYLSTEDDSRGEPGVYGARVRRIVYIFASGFTSSFIPSNQSPCKRPKRSLSPHLSSKERRSAKSHTSPSVTRRVFDSSAPAKGLPQASTLKSHYVETFWRGEKLCFKNSEGQEIETEPQDGEDNNGRWDSAISSAKLEVWTGLEFWAVDLAEKLPAGKGSIR